MGTSRFSQFARAIAAITALILTATACTPGVEAPETGQPTANHLWSLVAQLINGETGGVGSEPTIDAPGGTGEAPADETVDPPTTEPVPPPTTPVPHTPEPPSVPRSDSHIAASPRMGLAGCPIYPVNNVFHADIRDLEVLPDSDRIIAYMGNERVSPPSSKVINGIGKGIPVNIVDSTVDELRTVVKQGFLLQPESLGKFPMPKSPRVQGYPGVNSDQHLLVFDRATCRSHEFFIFRLPHLSIYQAYEATAAFTLDLTSNVMPRSAATVSAVSMLSGMIRYDEVEAGAINHALIAGVPRTSSQKGIWPAAPRSDGPSSDPYAPRIGEWLRLKDIDTSGFGPKARVVIRAMQTHGVIITDTGGANIGLGRENDSRWDDEDLKSLKRITAADFEVIDASPMMVARDSYEIR